MSTPRLRCRECGGQTYGELAMDDGGRLHYRVSCLLCGREVKLPPSVARPNRVPLVGRTSA